MFPARARNRATGRGHDANAIARVVGHTDPGFTQRTYIPAAAVVRFDDLFAEQGNARRATLGRNPAAFSGTANERKARKVMVEP